jgi:hypothetical protein
MDRTELHRRRDQCCGRGGIGAHRVGTHRPGDVLDVLLPHIFEGQVELVPYLFAHDSADADSTGLGQGLQTRCDVHPVSEDVAMLDDDIAEIDPDAEPDAPVFNDIGVPGCHRALHLGGTPNRVHDTRKFHQHAVAGGLHNPPPVLHNFGIDEFAPMRFESFEGTFLVRSHQPRIARHVGGENSGETTGCCHIRQVPCRSILSRWLFSAEADSPAGVSKANGRD